MNVIALVLTVNQSYLIYQTTHGFAVEQENQISKLPSWAFTDYQQYIGFKWHTLNILIVYTFHYVCSDKVLWNIIKGVSKHMQEQMFYL